MKKKSLSKSGPAYLSIGTIVFDHYAREYEFGILKKKKQNKSLAVFLTNEECPKLLSGIVRGKKERCVY